MKPLPPPVLVRWKSSDHIALRIDAIELLLTERCDLFAPIVNDSSMHLLPQDIRLPGELVGDGESSAPQPLRSDCTEFVELGRAWVRCVEGKNA